MIAHTESDDPAVLQKGLSAMGSEQLEILVRLAPEQWGADASGQEWKRERNAVRALIAAFSKLDDPRAEASAAHERDRS